MTTIQLIIERCPSGVYRVVYDGTIYGYIVKQDTGPDKWTVENRNGRVLSSASTLRDAKLESVKVFCMREDWR